MKTDFKKISLGSLSFLAPLVSFAQIKSHTFKGIVGDIAQFLGKLVMPMLFALALALFVWGIVDFIGHAENSDARKRGKQRIVWGIVGLTAMVTYIALTSVLTQTFFGENAGLPLLWTNNN